MNNIRVINDYIKGEPLSRENVNKTTELIKRFLEERVGIKLCTNYLLKELFENINRIHFLDYLITEEYENISRFDEEDYYQWQRFNILKYVDILVELPTKRVIPMKYYLQNKVNLGDYL